MTLSREIDKLLPQTQCGLCGYAGCRPYAEAIATGHAPIDRCPPGGIKTLHALGKLLAIDPSPYVATHVTRPPARAVIREAECIGCSKCIQACPVDAIVGARKFMHSIVTIECTGCGLCIAPCPVDCIDLQDVEGASGYDPNLARARHTAKKARIADEKHSKVQHYQTKASLVTASSGGSTADKAAKQAYVLAALARVGKN